MKMNINNFKIAIIFASAITFPNIAYSKPAGSDQIHFTTSAPKKNDETAFSYLVVWRKGVDTAHRMNGLTFMNGPDKKKPTTDVESARKIAKALNDALDYEVPSWRGAIAEATKGKPEAVVSNREGFNFVQVTFRDYSNQKLSYDIPGKSFQSAAVNIAIDIVYAGAIEQIEGLSVHQNLKSNGGFVRVSIDNAPPIEIKTDGKSAQQIEKELAQALGSKASFSAETLYPNYLETGSRNYKPFDGGEIQLIGLNAKTISIDIDDTGLGTLTKFQFPDAQKPVDIAGRLPYIIGFLVIGVLGYIFYVTQIKNRGKEEQEDEG